MTSTIHIRVPAAHKGRWIRASRAAGMRLSDWIVTAVESHMEDAITRLAVPASLSWHDLRLARDADGQVSFDWAPIETICAHNRLPVEILRDGPEDYVAALIVAWYAAHRANGGAPDPVADDLIAEAQAEDAAGQRISLPPGRA